jgi:hypothetical protein
MIRELRGQASEALSRSRSVINEAKSISTFKCERRRINWERSSTIAHRNLKRVPGGILKKMRKFYLPPTRRALAPKGARSEPSLRPTKKQQEAGGESDKRVSQTEIKRVQFEARGNFAIDFSSSSRKFFSRMKDDT